MKNTLLCLLLFFNINSFAQNYKGVVLGDTTYYTGGKFEMPFPFENEKLPNLLRTIWIEDAQLVGLDSVFTFYPSVRRDFLTINCFDTVGPTWLGKGFLRKPDGTEIYKNLRNDEITILTLSQINDTWKITTDSNGIEIWGVVSQIGSTMIENSIDSIKEITLQAMVAGNPVAHFHNGKKIILSKEHGFFKTFEFYFFPYEDYFGGAYDEYFPKDSSTYTRVKRNITIKDHGKFNFQTMFTPGTKWQYIDSSFHLINGIWSIDLNYVEDSISSKIFLTPNTIVIKKSRTTVKHAASSIGPPPPNLIVLQFISTIYSTQYDTIGINSFQEAIIRNHLMPEYTYSEPWSQVGSFLKRYRLNQLTDSTHILYSFYSNDNSIFYNPSYSCISYLPSVSGQVYDDIGFLPDANFFNMFHLNTNQLTGQVENVLRRELFYYVDGNISTQTWGTPLNMKVLSLKNEVEKELPVVISPNPSNNGLFYIHSIEDLNWEVFNLNSLKVKSGKSKEINLVDNACGFYLLKISYKDKLYYKKLIR